MNKRPPLFSHPLLTLPRNVVPLKKEPVLPSTNPQRPYLQPMASSSVGPARGKTVEDSETIFGVTRIDSGGGGVEGYGSMRSSWLITPPQLPFDIALPTIRTTEIP